MVVISPYFQVRYKQEDPQQLDALSPEHRKMAELMMERRPEQGPFFVRVQNDIRRWQKKKEIALARLANERDGKPYTVNVINLKEATLRSLPIAGYMHYVENGGSIGFHHVPPVDVGD